MSGQSSPKRPRLSLQIKALSSSPSIRTSRTLAAVVNPRSPTSFNTLSNVYSTAIDRSTATPRAAAAAALTALEPLTAIQMPPAKRVPPDLPRLQMPGASAPAPAPDRRTHTPYVVYRNQFPETPLTARPMSPASVVSAMDRSFPSTMTATPPLSAGPLDAGPAQNPFSNQNQAHHVFCFSPDDINRSHLSNTTRGPDDGAAVTTAVLGNGDGKEGDDDRSSKNEATLETTPGPSEISSGEIDKSAVPRNTTISNTTTACEHEEPNVVSPSPPPLPPPMQLCSSGVTPASRRRIPVPALMVPSGKPAPYVHPRSLHSILRNSPLPPRTVRSPDSPRRQSQRLLDKAARHVMYNSPLTQTITTNTYTKSHIDLLCEEASPYASPLAAVAPGGSAGDGGTPGSGDGSGGAEFVLDLTLAYTGDETRDGGTTPGPFEEMRRRMAGLGTSSEATTPVSAATASPGGSGLGGHSSSGGIRKRKQPWREKKRRWVWTLGQEDEDEESLSGAMAALKAIQKAEAEAKAAEAAAAGTEVAATPLATSSMSGTDMDAQTPLATAQPAQRMLLPAADESRTVVPTNDDDTFHEDVEMEDAPLEMKDAPPADVSDADAPPTETAETTETADTTGTTTDTTAQPQRARNRKSTPIPDGDSDVESLCGGDGDGDGDVDMQTSTVLLGQQLQGTWMQAAAALTGTAAAGQL